MLQSESPVGDDKLKEYYELVDWDCRFTECWPVLRPYCFRNPHKQVRASEDCTYRNANN